MKTKSEIKEKINTLADTLADLKTHDLITAEQIACQIDMLLWVIEDKSGLPPLDERI